MKHGRLLKVQVSVAPPGPGASNSGTHTCPERDAGFTTVKHIFWRWALRDPPFGFLQIGIMRVDRKHSSFMRRLSDSRPTPPKCPCPWTWASRVRPQCEINTHFCEALWRSSASTSKCHVGYLTLWTMRPSGLKQGWVSRRIIYCSWGLHCVQTRRRWNARHARWGWNCTVPPQTNKVSPWLCMYCKQSQTCWVTDYLDSLQTGSGQTGSSPKCRNSP